MRRPSLVGIIGLVVAITIVLASVVARRPNKAGDLANVRTQRAAVMRFDALVRAQRWDDVFRLTAQPPAHDAASFAALMQKQVDAHGSVVGTTIREIRLLRSRTVPLLEVRERVTMSKDGRQRSTDMTSFFARRGTRWLFAFSAPG